MRLLLSFHSHALTKTYTRRTLNELLILRPLNPFTALIPLLCSHIELLNALKGLFFSFTIFSKFPWEIGNRHHKILMQKINRSMCIRIIIAEVDYTFILIQQIHG